MTSEERVLAAIRRTAADRPPAGSMGLGQNAAANVRRFLGASDDANVYHLLGVDFANVIPAYIGPEFSWKPVENRRNFFGSSDRTYRGDDVAKRPLHDAATVREVESFPWPTAADYDCSQAPRQIANAGGRAIKTSGWTPTFTQLCEMFGMETALVHLAAAPELIEAGAERITELIVGLLCDLHDVVGDRLLIFKTADDLATQRGLMFSPQTWRRIFKPGLARQFAVAKARGLITWFHSCGDVSLILPDLVEIGLDVLEPSQVHLPGMRPEWLKREFGKHLTFFGAISTQTTLPFGAPEDVRREVRERIRVLGADGGGYIPSPDHTILEGVPPENIIALYDEVGSLRR